jgi:hypothetical protein
MRDFDFESSHKRFQRFQTFFVVVFCMVLFVTFLYYTVWALAIGKIVIEVREHGMSAVIEQLWNGPGE